MHELFNAVIAAQIGWLFNEFVDCQFQHLTNDLIQSDLHKL